MNQKSGYTITGRRVQRIVATATALTFFCQNFAWAVCADGTTFPPGGFVGTQPPATNWSPNIFTASAGSIFVPDNSVFEHNDPNQPVTGGGHNWVFDQGTTTCKAIDTGPAGGTPTAWTIPTPESFPDCVFLPGIVGVSGTPSAPIPLIRGLDDIPYQGNAITPTCDPTQYVGGNPLVGPALPTNTYFNHLGCSISHGAASTPQTATTYLFVAGIHGGVFVLPLTNVPNPTVGGDAGKTVVEPSTLPGWAAVWFGQIPLGQKLTNAAVSPDGQFALAMSLRRSPLVFGCYNPLGDPTRTDPVTGVQSFPITGPVDPNFSVAPANTVPCMLVGTNGGSNRTVTFGPDDQPYFGGAGVSTFNADPGGPSATAWPQCIFNGFVFTNPPPTLMGKLAVVFNARSASRCGAAVPNVGFAGIAQVSDIISHGSYMYAGGTAGPTLQSKVTSDPVSGLSQYANRTYVSGLAITTGLGVADDLKSFMDFTDLSGIGSFNREEIVKLPLCEDM
jgi:hypothetical protein